MNPWVPYENGTVYICDDGSVDPSGAPILRKGDLYTLADNVISDGDGIVVERDNIVLDGAGYIVQGAGTSNGVDLSGRSNVTVKNAAISNFHYGIYFTDGNNATLSGVEVRVCDYGIWFYSASNSSILSNTVTGCAWMGITVYDSISCMVSDNNVTDNNYGVWLQNSIHSVVSNNVLVGCQSYALYIDIGSHDNNCRSNIFKLNEYDVYLAPDSYNNTVSENNFQSRIDINKSPDNTFLHNNFLNGSLVTNYYNYGNAWDNGFEGNFWEYYNETDSNNDGVGDSPCFIDANNTDHYPLMGMFYDFNAAQGKCVQTICNSSISDFQFNDTTISFNVSGENDTTGFCRICIPTALMNDTYRVFVNGTEVQCNLLPCSNSSHSYLYFTYDHSIEEIVIVPEYTPLIILSLFMLATLQTVMVHRKRGIKNRKTISDDAR